MSGNTKLILLGMAIVVILGIVLQTMVTANLEKSMGNENALLSPDEKAKLRRKEELKTQKKFEAKVNAEAAKANK